MFVCVNVHIYMKEKLLRRNGLAWLWRLRRRHDLPSPSWRPGRADGVSPSLRAGDQCPSSSREAGRRFSFSPLPAPFRPSGDWMPTHHGEGGLP